MILETLIVMATCYHATKTQCNADYLTTADGTRIESTETAYNHRILAVSRDLLSTLPLGTLVAVESPREEICGIWRVADKMNARHTNTIDFLLNPDMSVFKEEVSITPIYNRK